MICPKCNANIADNSIFCNICGAKIKKDKNKNINKKSTVKETGTINTFFSRLKPHKKNIFTVLSVIIIIAILIPIGYNYIKRSQEQARVKAEEDAADKDFESFVSLYNDDIKKAEAFYFDNKENWSDIRREKFEENAKQYILEEINKIKKDYISMEIDNKAFEKLRALDWYQPTRETLSNTIKELSSIKTSRRVFEDAQKYIDKTDYSKAILALKKVDNKNTNEYGKAQKMLSETIPKYKEQVLSKAEDLYKHQKYTDVLNLVDASIEVLPEDEKFKMEISEYISKCNKAEEEKAKELSTLFVTYTDEVTNLKQTRVKTLGKNYTLSNGDFVIYPSILDFDSGSPSFDIEIGIGLSDWIFFNTIIINCDGNIYNIEVPSIMLSDSMMSKVEEVQFGGVTELLRSLYTPDLAELFPRNAQLYKALKKAAYSKKALIKFAGDNYHKNYTISEQQKEILRLTIEYYELLI